MQSTSSICILACLIACFTNRTTHLLWCAAVSFGRKPVPGGETKVCRRFASIWTGGEELFDCEDEASSSEKALSCGDGGDEFRCAELGGCSITPTPSLLAEPSRPIAIGIVDILLYARCCGSFTCQRWSEVASANGRTIYPDLLTDLL